MIAAQLDALARALAVALHKATLAERAHLVSLFSPEYMYPGMIAADGQLVTDF